MEIQDKMIESTREIFFIHGYDGSNSKKNNGKSWTTSMKAGNMKVAFGEHGKEIELAIPTTVVGDSFRTSGMSGAHRVAVHLP